MTWVATVGESRQIGDHQETQVLLSNGVEKFQQSYRNDGTLPSLRSQVLATIAARDPQTLKLPTIAAGTSIDCTPDAPVDPPPPSDAEKARASFFAAYRRVQSLQRALATGLSAVAQKTVDDAVAALNALAYDASYEASL